MKARMKVFSLLLVFCVGICYTEGSAVCTVLKTRQASISAATTVYSQNSYSISCGWWLFRRRCTVYRARSSIQYVTNYITEYYQGQECCTGYSGTPPNCSPVCNDPCSNCASCIAPGICTCDPGYTDNDCCTDINECLSSNGDCEHQCHNTDGSYTCSCPTGFSLVSHTACKDIDECASANGGCSQICKNTPGSYYCECYPGYTLGSDNHTCNDNDECNDNTDACSQVCHNTVGSYACSCNSGYSLATSDHRTCTDINECLDGDNGGCHGTCTNTVGSRTCSCSSGYVLTNGNECHDKNECLVSNSGCAQNCHNTIGSFTCSCNAGYALSSDGKGCIGYCHPGYNSSNGLEPCSPCPSCQFNDEYRQISCMDCTDAHVNNGTAGCYQNCLAVTNDVSTGNTMTVIIPVVAGVIVAAIIVILIIAVVVGLIRKRNKSDSAFGKVSSKPRASIASPNDVLSLMPHADPVSKYDVDENEEANDNEREVVNPLFLENEQQESAYESLSHLQMKVNEDEGPTFEKKEMMDPSTLDDADDRYTVTTDRMPLSDELKGIGGLAGRKAALFGK